MVSISFVSLNFILFPIVAILLALFWRYAWNKLQSLHQTVFTQTDKESLIGVIDPTLNPYKYAHLYISEVEIIWESELKMWRKELDRNALVVESRQVRGRLETFHIPLQRARATVSSKFNSTELFTFLTSPDGVKLMRPVGY